jgi:hypothetical protein
MVDRLAFTSNFLFTGKELLHNSGIVIEDGVITFVGDK